MELCTACLVAGRHLHGVREDGDEADQLYRQILNEVNVTQDAMSTVPPRVCWECRASLHRFMRFKRRVAAALQRLMLVVRQGGDVSTVARAPRLLVHCVVQLSCSATEAAEETQVKAEPTLDLKPEELPPPKLFPLPEVAQAPEVTPEPDAPEHVEPASFACSLPLGDHWDAGDAGDDTTHDPTPPETTKQKPKVKTKKQGKPRDPKPQKLIRAQASRKTKQRAKPSLRTAGRASTDAGGVVSAAEDEKVKSEPEKDGGKELLEKVKPPAERPVCAECGKQFSSRKTYRYHINVLHKGQNRYPCPHCGKEYQWKSNLWRHIKNHKAVASGELYCAPCDRRFSSVATLRQHQRASRSHVRETDFSFMCTTCGARFVSAARLRDHVDWEHLQRARHRCRLCDKAFKSGTSLSAHAKTVHARASRLLCHVCGQRYQSAAKLKYHISAMHTRAAPYSCGSCGAAFRWYSSLYRHARQLHDKVKPPKKPRSRATGNARQPPTSEPVAPPELAAPPEPSWPEQSAH